MSEEERPGGPRLPVDEGREHLMVQVARMAWQQDRTQTEIAAETGLNRWQVSRLLQDARDLGIVRIEIVPRLRRRPEVEAALVEAYGLRDAMVVPEAAGADAVAQAAGQYLAAIKPRPRLIGVSWGRTMAAVAHWLPPDWADGVQVVQINGTVAPIPQTTGHNEVAETFARKGRGAFVPLPVPAVVGARVTREVLEQDRIVGDVLRLARSAPVLCFSMGALSEDAALVQSGNVTPAEIAALAREGAVGDVLGRYVDRRGEIVDEGLDARTVGLALADLKARDRAIGVASGRAKHRITLAALRAGLVNVLVTDEETAAYALEHVHDR
ncbi:sugar-binding transcriptional regulator [Rubellimicrobium arenae]|uniref:sugar-binding transcriptional regulator n=1 Tax=Rubellimicrobium arenae TaxID=2817372 RepID=UPI001B30608F|nr:sugar-binding transcriptional regulator [Rubellimicrobium arenae]